MGFFDDLDNLGKTLQKDFGKVLKDEAGEVIKTLGSQITGGSFTSSSPPPVEPEYEPDYFFTKDFHEDAQSWGLTEEDAIDVYNFGFNIDDEKYIRRYNGYKIGIKISYDKISGKPIFKEIWRRDC